MTLRDRAFRRYDGPVTSRRWRFLTLWRYSRREVFASRRVTAIFALSFAPLIGALAIIYLRHNLPALQALELSLDQILAVDGSFFLALMMIQGAFMILLTALVGPGLVSPDLANNGLPLYLCRPFSRTEYVLGKLSVLVILASAMSWVPLLALIAIQASLEPGWLGSHLHLVSGVFFGSWIAILCLGLLALALSAWVKWRILASAMTVAVLLVADGVSEFVNESFHTEWGQVFSPGDMIITLWERMLTGAQAVTSPLPTLAVWTSLAAFVGACLLILHLKLRAYEVVR